MSEHSLFYFPYASFTGAQLPLMKVAALYFDKLVLLDPVGASLDGIGTDHIARDAVRQMESAGLLELVTPAAVLAKHGTPIADAVRRDMGDREFLDLCDAHAQATGKHRWTLSLAKVPQDLQADQTMRQLMGDFARDVSSKTAYAANDYIEHIEALGRLPGSARSVPNTLHEQVDQYREYAERGQAYDEYREGYEGEVEYRYADFPLALGEAIMMNHALFAGLLYANATPITDDPFHSQALANKLRRAAQEPTIRQAMRRHKAGAVAAAVFRDAQIALPILGPEVPLAEVLEHRQGNSEGLARARDALGQLSRRIHAEPWTRKFKRELETETLPDVTTKLAEAGRARDAWLETQRTKNWIKTTSIAAGVTTAMLTFVIAPVTPIALAVAGLGLVSGSVIPGAEWLLDWRTGKKALHENGLHYLLTV